VALVPKYRKAVQWRPRRVEPPAATSDRACRPVSDNPVASETSTRIPQINPAPTAKPRISLITGLEQLIRAQPKNLALWELDVLKQHRRNGIDQSLPRYDLRKLRAQVPAAICVALPKTSSLSSGSSWQFVCHKKNI
jgi:hypothetical protein